MGGDGGLIALEQNGNIICLLTLLECTEVPLQKMEKIKWRFINKFDVGCWMLDVEKWKFKF